MLNLPTVIPNPCKNCDFFSKHGGCTRFETCAEYNRFYEMVKQRDADIEVLKPIVEALKEVAINSIITGNNDDESRGKYPIAIYISREQMHKVNVALESVEVE
jgi:hypothetical protein